MKRYTEITAIRDTRSVALIALCLLIQCFQGGNVLLRALPRERQTQTVRGESREEEEGGKKKTGIKIDFSIMLAVSRGRHMF